LDPLLDAMTSGAEVTLIGAIEHGAEVSTSLASDCCVGAYVAWPLWHPGVSFVLCWEIYLNLGCSVKISISWSHSSPFIKLLMNVSPNLKLIDLKNNQIWSLLKLLYLKANANSKVNLVSQLPSRLIYSDSRQLWCYLIYVRICFLDSQSMSKYLI
jgi:hypothetical protein